MNYEYLKKKMDEFFANSPTERLVAEFKALGYTFDEDDNSHSVETELTVQVAATCVIGATPEYKTSGNNSYAMAA